MALRTENGERRTENGERRTENGERRTENGERRTENGISHFASFLWLKNGVNEIQNYSKKQQKSRGKVLKFQFTINFTPYWLLPSQI